jgi:hypothetical protein
MNPSHELFWATSILTCTTPKLHVTHDIHFLANDMLKIKISGEQVFFWCKTSHKCGK